MKLATLAFLIIGMCVALIAAGACGGGEDPTNTPQPTSTPTAMAEQPSPTAMAEQPTGAYAGAGCDLSPRRADGSSAHRSSDCDDGTGDDDGASGEPAGGGRVHRAGRQ